MQPVELLRIAGILRCARNIKGYVAEDDKATVLDALFQALSPNKYLEDKIFGCDLSEEEIADNASSELSDHRRHMRIQAGKIRDSLQKVISSPAYSKFLREPIITIRQGRYVVPVKASAKTTCPDWCMTCPPRVLHTLWSRCPPSTPTTLCGSWN